MRTREAAARHRCTTEIVYNGTWVRTGVRVREVFACGGFACGGLHHSPGNTSIAVRGLRIQQRGTRQTPNLRDLTPAASRGPTEVPGGEAMRPSGGMAHAPRPSGGMAHAPRPSGGMAHAPRPLGGMAHAPGQASGWASTVPGVSDREWTARDAPVRASTARGTARCSARGSGSARGAAAWGASVRAWASVLACGGGRDPGCASGRAYASASG